ncbi:MAG: LysR substrate-binding domain-containing protein [Candidatus Cryptobacteroides sp.]
MELRQLKYFVKTAQTLNFSEAARLLYVTQSTLSQQVRQLEIELGTTLFTRDSHSVQLTESGEQLLPLAQRTLQDAAACQDRIKDLQQMLSGSLNIGITYTFAPLLTETLMEFMKIHPGVKLNIYYKTMEELMEMLCKRELDFVLAFKPSSIHEDIESHVLFDNCLSIIAGKDHPLAVKESVTLADIKPYSIAMPSKGLQARNAFDKMFPGACESLNIRVELNEVNVLLDLVHGSNLITVLSSAVLQSSDLKAIPLEVPHNVMEGCVHTLRKSYRKRAAEEFIKLLRDSVSVRKRANYWLE